jgi:hypothetical protein
MKPQLVQVEQAWALIWPPSSLGRATMNAGLTSADLRPTAPRGSLELKKLGRGTAALAVLRTALMWHTLNPGSSRCAGTDIHSSIVLSSFPDA